ncbi:WD40 repeat-like protein [Rhizopogon salebrosus TDB-379]|nr:WD40 repeat-like protein [Rhizopogon salebrosus TDB-379]
MSSPTAEIQMKPVTKARQVMQGHSRGVRNVVHLPGGRRIISCSDDGSLRLWDLETGAQIGNDWRDVGDETEVFMTALSPNGNIIASGHSDGMVRLWDVGGEGVIAKCIGHTSPVWALCWNADGDRMVTGAEDGTVRVWEVESAETVLGPIESGHEYVHTVIYSPDKSVIGTGGFADSAVKIWDADTGELLFTIEHDYEVWSLAWTSDGEKLISGSGDDSIGIFDTDTWQQVATLEGHEGAVLAMSLFQNDRLLASASWDQTARLWDLDKNLPVGLALQHEADVISAAISVDGKLLVTSCADNNTWVWDIHTVLKDAGLEHLLSIPNVAAGKSLIDANATRRPDQLEHARRLIPRGFFGDAQDGVHPSVTPGNHSRSSTCRRPLPPSSSWRPRALLAHFSSLFHSSPPNTNEPVEFQQRSRRSMPSQHIDSPHPVEVPAVRDKETLFVAGRPERISDMVKRIKNPTWWTRCVLFICCVSIPHDGQTPLMNAPPICITYGTVRPWVTLRAVFSSCVQISDVSPGMLSIHQRQLVLRDRTAN